jgi:predicted secreted protein
MQVQSINFSVSDDERKRVENELMVEASQAFQQRARLLQQSWQASGYELVSLDLNAMNNERPPIMYAMKARDTSGAMESQNVQGGNSQLRVNASGSVQLR